MDLVGLAKEVVEEEVHLSVGEAASRLPQLPKSKQSRQAQNIALGIRALQMRIDTNRTWPQIAEELGVKSVSTIYLYASKARALLDVDTKDDKRFVQRHRLNKLFVVMEGRVQKGGKGVERAAEVAVKILEREARLDGLDLEGASQEDNRQAIVINIQPHPGDKQAQEFVAANSKLLPSPIIDVPFVETIHLSDRGNGVGENVERTILGTEET